MTATLSEDRATVTLRGALWSVTFPVADLPAQLRLYRGLRDRGGKSKGQPGPYARFYAGTVQALEGVAGALR